MIKRITALLTAAVLMLCSAIPCFAENNRDWQSGNVPSERLLPRAVDYTDTFSSDELDTLNSKLDDISAKWGVDVVCVLDTDYESYTYSATSYADDYYDYNGFRNDGIALAVFTVSREWAISTKGSAISTFTDKGQSDIISDIKSYMSNGDYYEAFYKFADKCDEYLQYEKDNGKAKTDSSGKNLIIAIAISVVIGVIVGFIGSGMMKSKLKSVKFQSGAANYVVPNTFNLSNAQDVYLYSTVTKTRRESDSSSGSGGSSTHSSSSGSTHGGSSGSF